MKVILYLSGALGCVAIIFGSLFKILHYPGGNELYVIAAVILGLVYLPVFAIMRFKKAS